MKCRFLIHTAPLALGAALLAGAVATSRAQPPAGATAAVESTVFGRTGVGAGPGAAAPGPGVRKLSHEGPTAPRSSRRAFAKSAANSAAGSMWCICNSSYDWSGK